MLTVLRNEFGNLDVAYAFYNMYTKLNGFDIHQYKVGQSVDDSILWQTFVYCK